MKAQRAAMNRMAPRGKAPHIKATRTAHWQQWVFRVVLARKHGTVSHLAASQAGARQGTEFQSNADCPLATAGFPSRFGSKAARLIALWGSAGQRIARQRIASKCRARRSTVWHFKATRTEVWQQTSLQVALAYWVGFHPLFY
jgi:hypothetical protein